MSLRPAPRRGVVLLVVLIMLTLFAIVGITFVYLSDHEATGASFYKAAETKDRPTEDILLAHVLNQLMCDHDVNNTNAASSMKSHGLASGLYGWSGVTPYSGIGRLHGNELTLFTNPLHPLPPPLVPQVGLDKFDLLNFFGRSYTEATYGALSAPYTYTNNNNAWLGASNADGLVLARSFVRTFRLPIEKVPPTPGSYNYIPFNPYALDPSPLNSDNPGWFWDWRTYWQPDPTNPNRPDPTNPVPPLSSSIPPGIGIMTRLNRYLAANAPPGSVFPPGFVAVMTDPFPITQLNWRNLALRALVTRPGPWDHPDFAPPDDYFGDVKNLPPGSGVDLNNNGILEPGDWFGNESYWQHIGFPIQVGADGRRYVPLYAFHIQTLDGKINVNAAGNVWGANAAHTSNQGWGAWEVNPSRLLNLPSPGGPTEGVQLFRGRPTTYPALVLPTDFPLASGRYGLGVAATALPPASYFQLWPLRTPFYGSYDADGARDTSYNLSDPYRLPGDSDPFAQAPETWNYDRFPRFSTKDWTYGPPPPATPSTALGWSSGNPVPGSETLKVGPVYHPGAFNYFAPQLANRLFPVSSMEALLRHGDTGADSLTSDLRDLLINNMTSTRTRRLVTTHSADIERPGVLPYWDGDQAGYVIPGMGGPPNAIREMPPRGPAQATPGTPSALGTEFTAEGRALSALLGRIDINRPLPQYPLVQSNPVAPDYGRIVDIQSFNQALLARQELARDIYRRLLVVTGAEQGLNTFTPPLVPVPPERVNVLRYLAQLAVNIVDARDYDDYNTSFDWGAYIVSLFPNLAAQPDFAPVGPEYSNWVFGTELPRVVINEVYVEHPSVVVATPTDANLWVELYNPLRSDPVINPLTGLPLPGPDPYPGFPNNLPWHTAKLQMPAGTTPAYGIYRLIIAKTAAGLRDLDNVRGDVLPPGNILPVPAGTPAILDDWTDPDAAVLPNTEYIMPSDDNYSGIRRNAGTIEHQYAADRGWYLLGPLGATFPAGGMPYPPVPTATLSRPQLTVRYAPPGETPTRPTLVLQRLMCPHLPPQPDPTMPMYNPYITVDYFESADLNDTGATPVAGRHSLGRKQPYAARLTLDAMGNPLPNAAQANLKQQTPDSMPPGGARADQPLHTFFRHNSVEEVNYTVDSTIPAPAGQVDTLKIDYDSDGRPEPPTDPPGVTAPPPTGQTLRLPFDWLQHFDRDFVSPMELLHVSAFKPHELTQQFMVDRLMPQTHFAPPLVIWPGGVYPPPFPTTPPGPPVGMGIIGDWPEERFQHVIRWFDDAVNSPSVPPPPLTVGSNRLHRALEFLQTRNRASGTSQVTLLAAVVGPVDSANFPFLYRVQVPALNWASTDAAGNVVIGRGANGGLWEIKVGACVAINGGAAVRVTNILNPSPGVYQFDAYFPGSIFQTAAPNPTLSPDPPVTAVTVTYLDGQQPGKININLLTDIEVWRALCDAQPANTFNPPLPVPLPPSPLSFGGGAVVGRLTPLPILIPAGGLSYVAGPPDYLKGGINGVEWLLREGDPAAMPTFRGTFLEFNDPVLGRETVEVINIVDNSAAATPHFEIHYVAVDANLNRTPVTPNVAVLPNVRQLDHQRDATNPFPIAVDNVSTMFARIVASRDSGRPFLGQTAGFIAAGDSQYPNGTSVVDTFLRRDPIAAMRTLFESPPMLPVSAVAGQPVLSGTPLPPTVTQPSAVHPQRAQEILAKISNNLTTRSNVFAVSVTVGFFEVYGPNDPIVARRNTIGAEIGRVDGRHKRHRMFAIIDRTSFDSYVQTVDAYLRTITNNEYRYDVSGGAVLNIATPPTFLPTSANIVIPIVGSNLIDPRRPYNAVVSYQQAPNPPVTSPPIPLPPSVLYWSVIE